MLIVGADIGGTFTDLYLFDPENDRSALVKVLTTPENPSEGLMEGLGRLLGGVGAAFPDVRTIIHGTTLVANAIIERKGAKTGLITTSGFRDVLEMRREKRYDMPDLLEDALNKKAVDGAPTVSGYVLSGCWADVGTFEAYREANGRRT